MNKGEFVAVILGNRTEAVALLSRPGQVVKVFQVESKGGVLRTVQVFLLVDQDVA